MVWTCVYHFILPSPWWCKNSVCPHLALPGCRLFQYSLWLYLLLFCCHGRKPWQKAALGREGLLGLQFQRDAFYPEAGALAAGVWGWSITCYVQEVESGCKTSKPIPSDSLLAARLYHLHVWHPPQTVAPAWAQMFKHMDSIQITRLGLFCIALIRNAIEASSHT